LAANDALIHSPRTGFEIKLALINAGIAQGDPAAMVVISLPETVSSYQ